MEYFGTVIIAIAMIWAVINFLNRERTSEGKKSLGCFSILIVILVILVFWWFLGKI